MLSDLYVVEVQGDQQTMYTVRLGKISPEHRWLRPRRVLAAVRENGWFRLVFLCGTNPYAMDNVARDYPRSVTRVWSAFNPGCLAMRNEHDVARELLEEGAIGEVLLDAHGRIVQWKGCETEDNNG